MKASPRYLELAGARQWLLNIEIIKSITDIYISFYFYNDKAQA
jgi:hypothetical protein